MRRRRRAGRAATHALGAGQTLGAGLALGAALVLAGCAPAPPPDGAQTPSLTAPDDTVASDDTAASVTTVPQDAAQARAAGTPTGVGGLTAVTVHPTATSPVVADGTATWTFAYAPEVLTAVAEPLLLAAPEGGAFEDQGDGSLLVVDATGTPVAALAPPTASAGRASWSLRTPDLAGLRLDGGTDAAAPAVAVELGATAADAALAAATWGEREGGRSLAVAPAPWVRGGSAAALALLEAQLVASEPEAASATMQDQLLCHMIGAPDKETWNLEPWRPDVGLVRVLAAQCNPE